MRKQALLIGIILSVIMFFGAQALYADPPYLFWPAGMDFQVGMDLRDIATADFNNDGNADFALANLSSSYISVLLGDGNGAFVNSGNTSGFSQAVSITTADFNEDGNYDLALARYDRVGIYAGDGTGIFSEIGSYTFNPSVVFVTAEDFNNDGNADLALITAWQAANGNIYVLLGDGNGSFSGPLGPYGVGGAPHSMAAAHFNNDNNLDLAVVNEFSQNLSILLGDGNGGFISAGSVLTGGSYPTNIATSDFDNDGDYDLAVTNQYNIAILLGDGNGSFTLFTNLNIPNTLFYSIVTTDLNNDGNIDLAVGGAGFSYDRYVFIFLGNGTGGFVNANNYILCASPYSIIATDVTNDNNDDIALAIDTDTSIGQTYSYVSVLFGDGTGNLMQANSYNATAVSLYSKSVAIADFNNDSNNDLLVGNYFPHNVSILLGDGNRDFDLVDSIAVDNLPYKIVASDFNNNDNEDFAVILAPPFGGACTLSIFLGEGTGAFNNAYNYTLDSSTTDLIKQDFNNDGNIDLAVVSGSTNNVTVFLGNGDGSFSNFGSFATNGTVSQFMTCADFNNDSNPDLAVTNSGSQNVSILFGNGNGSFSYFNAYTIGLSSDIVASDFNNDDNDDLAISDVTETVLVMLGNGAGGFPVAENYDVGLHPRALIEDDFNNDDNIDLATANELSNNISILIGNGAGFFQDAVYYGIAGDGPQSMVAADLDNDGRNDLAVTNYYTHNVSALYGNYSPVYVTLIPESTSVPHGQNLNITLRFINQTSQPQTFHLRGIVSSFSGHERTVLDQRHIVVPANEILEQSVDINIPNTTPLGEYTFTGYIGTSQEDIWDTDSFNFNVVNSPYAPIINYPMMQ